VTKICYFILPWKQVIYVQSTLKYMSCTITMNYPVPYHAISLFKNKTNKYIYYCEIRLYSIQYTYYTLSFQPEEDNRW